jgi:hypothetical protein
MFSTLHERAHGAIHGANASKSLEAERKSHDAISRLRSPLLQRAAASNFRAPKSRQAHLVKIDTTFDFEQLALATPDDLPNVRSRWLRDQRGSRCSRGLETDQS